MPGVPMVCGVCMKLHAKGECFVDLIAAEADDTIATLRARVAELESAIQRDVCPACVGMPVEHIHGCKVGYALARVAELEAERDRMRPVVSAAVKYDAALREYSERGDDDPEFQRPVTIAESALTEAVTAYLAATPKEPR